MEPDVDDDVELVDDDEPLEPLDDEPLEDAEPFDDELDDEDVERESVR
ncbi:hypothetical protein [Isoptericola variabilis]|nr:hypothetical protein [Isoptericola variabilis]